MLYARTCTYWRSLLIRTFPSRDIQMSLFLMYNHFCSDSGGLKLYLSYIRMWYAYIEESSWIVPMHIPSNIFYTWYTHSYSPLLWWSSVELERALVLREVSMRIFSLSPSSAIIKQSSKVWDRELTKSRVQLSNEEVDKQSFFIYNYNQVKNNVLCVYGYQSRQYGGDPSYSGVHKLYLDAWFVVLVSYLQ